MSSPLASMAGAGTLPLSPLARRQGVVLSGGGAFGAYAVGVLEALFDGSWNRGASGTVDPMVLSGSSVGAFSAAVLCQHSLDHSLLESVRYLRSLWLDRIAEVPINPRLGRGRNERPRPNGVFRVRGLSSPLGAGLDSRNLNLVQLSFDLRTWWLNSAQRVLSVGSSQEGFYRRLLRFFDARDLVSTRPLERLIQETLDPRRLLDPRARRLLIATTVWDSGHTEIFNNLRRTPSSNDPTQWIRLDVANALRAVLASAAVPGIFPMVRIGEHDYADGGVLQNAPLRPTIQAGANQLHVISFEPELEPIPFGRPESLFEAFERLLIILPKDFLDDEMSRIDRVNRNRLVARSLIKDLQNRALEMPAEQRRAVQQFVRDHARRHSIEIHRHTPTLSLGGAQSLLNFRRHRLIELMEQGYTDAVEHDCERNGCIVD